MPTTMRTTVAAHEAGRRTWARLGRVLLVAAALYAFASLAAVISWLVLADTWWNQPLNMTTFWWSLPALPLLAIAALARAPRHASLLAVPAVVFVWTYGSLFVGSPPAAEGDLRVVSYNVYIRSPSTAHVVDLVAEERPDVLLLQELQPGPAREIAAGVAGDLPHGWYGDPGQVGGVAVLSRHPIVEARPVAKAGRHSRPTSVVVLAVPHESGGARQVQVVPVHLTSPCLQCGPSLADRQTFEAAIRRAEMESIVDSLRSDVPAIVGGDFNSTRRSDPYRLLAAAGFRDPQVEAGWGPGFTWPTAARTDPGAQRGATAEPAWWRRRPFVRIDWILGRGLVPAAARVGAARASDHRAVVVDLAWPETDGGDTGRGTGPSADATGPRGGE